MTTPQRPAPIWEVNGDEIVISTPPGSPDVHLDWSDLYEMKVKLEKTS